MNKASNIKKLAIKTASLILKITNGQPFKYIYGGYGQILMFHRVCKNNNLTRLWNNSYLEVSPEYLEELIFYFKNLNYKFISLDQLYYNTKNIKPLKPFVIFTFDDGYKDNLTLAFPILKKHNIPMTIYITTDFPDKKAILWWDALEKKILNNNTIEFFFDKKKYKYTAFSLNEKEKLFEHIHKLISTITPKKRQKLINTIFTKQELENELKKVLTWQEINYLSQQSLITIGAHTISHNYLSQLTDEQSENEISKSIHKIEQKINKTVKHFAYPFGNAQSFGTREIKILQQNNILTATTTISKNITQKSLENLLALPRIAVGMSMSKNTFDLIRFGVIPMLRNKFIV